MAFTTTSNFAGKAAGFYISAALKASNSLDYLTLIENIKYKSNIQAMNNTVSAVADATCDFTGAGTLALTEKVLEPKNLQINLDLCKSTLLDSWEALQMRAGAGAPPPASFDDYVISYMGEIIAEATENSIWAGTNVAGQFNGFLGAVTGLLLPAVDATVVQDAAAGAYTAGTIIAELQGAVASIPTTTLGKEDLHIYMSQRTYQYYISAVSTLDGSDNMRMVARYSAGVQTGTGADIVRQS